MKKTNLFLLCWLVVTGAFGQSYNLPFRVPIVGYRGNVIQSDSLAFTPADTLQAITLEARYSATEGAQLTVPQPVLVRKGLKGVVRFNQSASLPQIAWYRVKVAGQTKYDGELRVGNTALSVSNADVLLVAGLAAQIGNLQAQISALQQVTRLLDPTDVTYLNLYSQLLLYK